MQEATRKSSTVLIILKGCSQFKFKLKLDAMREYRKPLQNFTNQADVAQSRRQNRMHQLSNIIL